MATTAQTHTPGILAETVISLSQAARRLPGSSADEHPHPSTILRWITRGTPTADGRRVRLEAVRCGSRWVTSTEAIERYTAALTAASSPAADPAPVRSPAARRRASDAASRRADELLA